MKRFLKFLIPLLLAAAIILSVGWYLLEFDPAFTRDMLLQSARWLEDSGNHTLSVWFYRLAYEQSDNNDQVAIELSEQFKAVGNYTKAEYTLVKAIADGGTPELYMALSKIYIEQDKLRDAVLMLDNIHNPAIKAELDALRPAPPQASTGSGTYTQYLSLTLSCPGSTVYYSLDQDYPSVKEDAYSDPVSLGGGETTIFAVSVGENGLVSPLAVYTYSIEGVIEEVKFQDPVVEAAVREALQVGPDQPLYSNDLWDLTALSIPDGSQSCADLKWMPKLKVLAITGSKAEDWDVLADLTELGMLTIADSSFDTDALPGIAQLPQLQALAISGCGISTIADLAGATQLLYLNLSNNTIRDISALSGMTMLKQLYLGSNALISLESIQTLTQLEALDVSYNSLLSTAPLANLTNLTHLNISSNELRSLDGISSLVNLQEFVASYNQLLDINALSSCTQITNLDVSHNTLLNIDPAAQLTKLEVLDFSYNEVAILPKFAKTSPLKSINGAHNQLKTLDPLSGLSNLTHIYMDYNTALSNIDSLSKCPVLEEVNVYGSKVRNVTKLTAAGIKVNYTPR